MIICIYDTETTGLLPKNLQLNANNSNKFPHTVQLSWILYDTITLERRENDFIVKCPVSIPDESTKIHGITNDISYNGYDISEALDFFLDDVKNSDLIVGFNLQYDLSIIEIELFRLNMFDEINMLFSKQIYDVMLKCVNICKISGKYGGYKYPKLSEAYFHFFKKDFQNQHDALGDVIATMDIYKKINKICF